MLQLNNTDILSETRSTEGRTSIAKDRVQLPPILRYAGLRSASSSSAQNDRFIFQIFKLRQSLLLGLVLSLGSFFWVGCNRQGSIPMSLDTIRSSSDTFTMRSASIDTAQAKVDTSKAALPPIARAIDPARLAAFLPQMPGWTAQGDLQKELQVRDTFNFSRAWQAYTMGTKTMTIQINDFAYVPSLYANYQKYKGTYLDDNNTERVETTIISGYPAVQTMEKKTPHAEVIVFPGTRYVVVIVEDGENDVNEVRRVAASMNLKGLESLQ